MTEPVTRGPDTRFGSGRIPEPAELNVWWLRPFPALWEGSADGSRTLRAYVQPSRYWWPPESRFLSRSEYDRVAAVTGGKIRL